MKGDYRSIQVSGNSYMLRKALLYIEKSALVRIFALILVVFGVFEISRPYFQTTPSIRTLKEVLLDPKSSHLDRVQALEALAREKEPLQGIDLSCQSIGTRRADRENDGTQARCRARPQLQGVDLSRVNVPRPNDPLFVDGKFFPMGQPKLNLSNSSFAGADLFGAEFSSLDLSSTDFSGIAGIGIVFAESDLGGADFTEAFLSLADFRWANLSEANLSGANLQEADLQVAYLYDTNISGADLRNAKFGANDYRSLEPFDDTGLFTELSMKVVERLPWAWHDQVPLLSPDAELEFHVCQFDASNDDREVRPENCDNELMRARHARDEALSELGEKSRKSCHDGDTMSCTVAARLQAEQTSFGHENNDFEIMSLLETACDGSDKYGCMLYSLLADNRAAFLRELLDTEEKCRLGDMQSCFNFAAAHASGKFVPKDSRKATSILEGWCFENVASACTFISIIHLSDSALDQSLGYRFALKGCELGDQMGCVERDWMMYFGIGIEPDGNRALISLKRRCDISRFLEACYRWAVLKKDAAATKSQALEMLERLCRDLFEPACEAIYGFSARNAIDN